MDRKNVLFSGKKRAVRLLLLCAAIASVLPAFAQVDTRLLLASGTEVPGHGGLAFGPFLSVAMNDNQDIVFLTSLRSPREELRAVVRSTGISFTVVAFQGLVGPIPRTTYNTFSAPSMNDSGVLAFTATLDSNQEDVPKVVVVRQEGSSSKLVATNLDSPPGLDGAKFEEFSAPLVISDGSLVFGARWSGKGAGSGLFEWSTRGLQALPLPDGLKLGRHELLEPFFVGHDEAAFLRRGTPAAIATEQFFRAIALQSFQMLQPPPDPNQTTELLAPRPDARPVEMLLVYLENASMQTVLLQGDPTKPVMVKLSLSTTPVRAVAGIESFALGPRGNIIFAATPTDSQSDLGLYCDCDGQEARLTTSEDFMPITTAGPGKPILSLTGDLQQTIAFIGPAAGGDNAAIYVTTIH